MLKKLLETFLKRIKDISYKAFCPIEKIYNNSKKWYVKDENKYLRKNIKFVLKTIFIEIVIKGYIYKWLFNN